VRLTRDFRFDDDRSAASYTYPPQKDRGFARGGRDIRNTAAFRCGSSCGWVLGTTSAGGGDRRPIRGRRAVIRKTSVRQNPGRASVVRIVVDLNIRARTICEQFLPEHRGTATIKPEVNRRRTNRIDRLHQSVKLTGGLLVRIQPEEPIFQVLAATETVNNLAE